MNFFNKENLNLTYLILLSAVFSMSIMACGSEESTDANTSDNMSNPVPTSTPTQNDQMQSTDAAANGDVVYHYTCPNNDGGGANQAGACSICGEQLVHNSAFHNQNNNTQPDIQMNQPQQAQPAAPSGPNANGEYHYICSAGHEDGASNTNGTCSVCGEQLVHNQAFHQ